MGRTAVLRAAATVCALLLLGTCVPASGDASGSGSQGEIAASAAAPPPGPLPSPVPDAGAVAQIPPVEPPPTTAEQPVEAPPAAAAEPPASAPAPPPVPPPPPPAPPPPPPAPRVVVETGWSPFAAVGGVVLHHPSSRVERVGFHESNHDGARHMDILASAANPIVLETRDRGTGAQTAADVVADPHAEIRAPVTGTVLRAGTYVLYCDYSDDFVVVEPDARPGWEVKILHINGVRVSPGMRVEAGVTTLAGGPTPLPFPSQVDDHTAEPSWPHVHLEVVDPSIPDRPSPGGGC